MKPFIEAGEPREDGSRDVSLNLTLSAGQYMTVVDSYFSRSVGTDLHVVKTERGPTHCPRKWWEKLLRREAEVIPAAVIVTSNHFDGR